MALAEEGVGLGPLPRGEGQAVLIVLRFLAPTGHQPVLDGSEKLPPEIETV